MTAAVAAPARPRLPRAAGAPLAFARLVRIELRRNAMPWIVPLMAALLWLDSYRPSTAMPPLWMLRTFWNMGQGHTIIDTGPLVAGVAAWMGSRDGRRGIADLTVTTARPRWTAQLAIWAATAAWAVAAYLALVGAMFAVYAAQGVRGTPPWWWLAVGAVAVTAFSAAGFAVGALFPSRFAAPLAAFGAFLAMGTSSQIGFSATAGWALLLPGGVSAVLRNVAGMAGLGLLCAAGLGGPFGWVGPAAYLVISEAGLAAGWSSPWVWPGRPAHDLGGAVCAGLACAAGLAAITAAGARSAGRHADPG